MTRFMLSLAAVCCCALSAVAKDTQPTVKNVLFVVSDDLKASVLGCYGDKICQTPNIDRLAAGGVVFDRAYCQGLVCRPSRKSFMFGLYPGRKQSSELPSMAEHFKNNSRYSARVGKIYHMAVPGDIIAGTNGGDHAESWTERFNCAGQEAHTPGKYALLNKNIFTTAEEDRQSTGDPHRMYVTVKSDGDGSEQPDYKAADKAIELLKANANEPFFLAVGFVRPHYPMVAPPKYFDAHPLDKITLPKKLPGDHDDIPARGRGRTTSSRCGIDKYLENQKRMWQGYYASVMFMDEQLGRILAELDRLGLRDNTTIVFTSDHGYHLGEHDFWLKNDLHEEVIRVPLIISVPDLEPSRAETFAELVDIYPTVAELAGLSIPKDLDGRSLVPALRDPRTMVRKDALSGYSDRCSLRTKDWAYIYYGKGGEELYDMKADPGQFTNLANSPEHADTLKLLRETTAQRKVNRSRGK